MKKVIINGKEFSVCYVLSKNRNAIAKLKGNTIMISLPSRWSRKDKDEIGSDLEKKSIKAIAKGSWRPEENRKFECSHGQRINAMGRDFEIMFIEGSRFGSKLEDNMLVVKVNTKHPQNQRKATDIVVRKIVKHLKQDIVGRVNAINDAYFRADITGVRIRNTTSIWGSCSPKGVICLNFRLLLLPMPILDYVIAHELAHMRYKSHGKRFWGLVERAIPDHRDRRKWLRENGWTFNARKIEGQQKITDYFHTRDGYEVS